MKKRIKKQNMVRVASLFLSWTMLLTVFPSFSSCAKDGAQDASNPLQTRQPSKPLSVEYALADDRNGYAEGSLTVKVDEAAGAEVVCYWANEAGRLDGYTPLAKFKVTGETTVRTFPSNTLIPSGATKLLVHTSFEGTLSEGYEVALPNAAAKPLGAPLFSFQVVSDTHINASVEDKNNAQYVQTLRDIVEISPNSTGLFIVGDTVNSGYLEEWQTFSLLHASVVDAPNYYLALGNHELYNGTYQTQIERFLQYAQLPNGENPKGCHYDFWQDGYHYVFLGNDALPVNGCDTTLNDETLVWLDETLATQRNANKPTFLFLHQSIYDTVSGSLAGQGWDGVIEHERLCAVLKKYPEVIMFNGHSHWTLDSERCMYPRNDALPTIFNTASVAYLWTSYDVLEGEEMEGSQGYYVHVYEDKVAVLGRDFIKGEWVSSAQFVVEYETSKE